MSKVMLKKFKVEKMQLSFNYNEPKWFLKNKPVIRMSLIIFIVQKGHNLKLWILE